MLGLCKDCKFWGNQGRKQEENGACLRYPPTVFYGGEHAALYGGDRDGGVILETVFPITTGEAGCGEFYDYKAI